MNPDDRKYRESHEWAKLEGSIVTVGITEHAAKELGDLTYLSELPEAGTELKRGEPFGEIESVKAVSELFSPVDGKVVESHRELEDELEPISGDPFGAGWMVKIEVSGEDALAGLMSAAEYEAQIKDD